jgi:dipeptidyl aminopeptidase/acylaminoacyl peptidase
MMVTFMRRALLLSALAGIAAGTAQAQGSPERAEHRYLSIRLSGDGQWLADVEGDSPPSGYYPPLRDLVIRHVRDGKSVTVPMPCGHATQCWPGSPTFSADSKRLAFALRSPGSHARAIYTVAADGSGLAKVLEFNGTIEDLRYLPDGRLAMLATENAVKEVGATEAGAPVAGDLDAAPPEQRIAVLDGQALRWASPPDLFVYEYDYRGAGLGFIGTAAPGDGDNNYWIAKLYAFANEGAARVIYTPADARQQLASPKVSPDGKTVAFIAGIMSDFGSTGGDVYALNLASGVALNLTPGVHASAEHLAFGCGGHLNAQWLAGDKTQLVDLGAARTPAEAKVLWSGEEALSGLSDMATACPSGAVAVEHQTFTAPPEIAVGVPGRWRDVTDRNQGLVLPATARSLWWKNDGFDVQGWLLLPHNATGKIPMIVIVHGGPAAAVMPQFIGSGINRSLLEHGYALFRPNPRGSFGQGERFTLANVRDFGYGDLSDILAGVDAAVRQTPVDPERLGLTGGSYGGFMTMWAVSQTHRFKAAVAGAGISNWLSYYGENGIDGWMIPYFGASAYEDPAAYERSSAIHFMRNVKTPTFAYVGERDIECPPAQTQEFWHAMKATNVPTSVMIYPGEGHGLRDPEHLADLTRRTLAWFDQYLR